ncbi:MAG TPA: LysR family transcriptional regulator [Polyangiaceae bacterium]
MFVKRMFLIQFITIVNVSIKNLNLNLLLVLDVLGREQNVTRAAKRLGLTQSAVSNALAQLRQALGDPLFVRARRGVVPTARALALAGPVRQALGIVESALESSGVFEPAGSSRSFVIAASDYTEYVVLPPLLRRLEREAPGVRLEVRAWGHHEVPAALETGEIDLMLGYYGVLPPGHHEQPLFEEEYACIVRQRHPSVRRRLTLKRYLALSHVLVTQRPGSVGSVDVALGRMGLTRRVGARVSHFLMVPQLVAHTDMVAALSRRIAEPAARSLGLVLYPPPLALPKSTVGQVWHERTETDAAQRWLRRVVSEVCDGV